ncbi:hypothetical protein GCM10027408_18540 [Microbacterium tumbae]
MDVLEEFEAPLPAGSLEQGDPRVIAVEADGRRRPFAAHLVPADDRETEIGEEGDGGLDVLDRDADVLERDRHHGLTGVAGSSPTTVVQTRAVQDVTTPWTT